MEKIFLKKNKACPQCLKHSFCRRGFTIIETMISISLFLVVVMAGMTALLNASALHQKAQNMRSLMDNLSFIMDDMSRTMRTGYNFHCIYDNDLSLATLSTPRSCSYGEGIAFTTASGATFVYFRSGDGRIFKSTTPPFDQGLSGYVQLNSFDDINRITIDPTSGFSVVGAEPPPEDTQQPLVIINLNGSMTSKGVTVPFSIQTAVSQRLIDL